jgi:hypothetical protein
MSEEAMSEVEQRIRGDIRVEHSLTHKVFLKDRMIAESIYAATADQDVECIVAYILSLMNLEQGQPKGANDEPVLP